MLAVALWLAAGCSGGRAAGRGGGGEKVRGDRTRVAHSEGVEPLWIQECPVHTDHLLTFCGEAHRKASQKSAYAEAYGDALGKLRRFIGQKVAAELEPDGQGGYRFSIRSAEERPVMVRGAWEGERWCEQYEGAAGRSHDCYAMISYPKLEYDRLLNQAYKAASQRVAKAIALHAEGRRALDSGNSGEARRLLGRAQKLLVGLSEPIVVEGKSSAVLVEQVAADLRRAAKLDQEAGRTALVVVGLRQDGRLLTTGREPRRVRDRVQKWLVNQGLKIRPGGLAAGQVQAILGGDADAARAAAAAKGAKLLLVLDLQCNFDSVEDQVFYSYAEGSFRLVWTEDGRELYTVDLPKTEGAMPFAKAKANSKAVSELLNNHVEPAVRAAVARVGG